MPNLRWRASRLLLPGLLAASVAAAACAPAVPPQRPSTPPAQSLPSSPVAASTETVPSPVAPSPLAIPVTVTPAPTLTPAPSVAPAEVVRHGPRSGKLVALTFDDGYNAATVKAIVRILRRTKTPATFFPTGRAVQLHPGLWRKIARAGFPLANHSFWHGDFRAKSRRAAAKDIRRAAALIERVTGVPTLPLFRPPYGAFDRDVLVAAGRAGITKVVTWDVDTRDWTGARPSSVVSRALKARGGSIVLLHTDKTNTVKALPKIIKSLRGRGFRLVTLDELLGLRSPSP